MCFPVMIQGSLISLPIHDRHDGGDASYNTFLVGRMPEMVEKIGFIGLGAMGGPMAKNLIAKGHPLTVYDIAEERMKPMVEAGANGAGSCKEVAEKTEVIITMLPSSPHVRKAILGSGGVIDGIREGSVVIDMSTIDPVTTREIERELKAHGVKMLDAPVARGVNAAVAGTLAIFVGGERQVFELCHPILSVMGTDIDYVGEIGAGEVVKIVNNLILAITVCALSEGLVLGVKAGVKPEVLFKALSQGSANSFALQNHFKKFVYEGKFEKGVFPVEYIIKDLNLALTTAENFHVPQYFGALAVQSYGAAVAAGLGDRYYPVIVKLLENLTGVEVRGDLTEG
jgi:3-hydroxyisobutyrate dehydrogenase